MRDLEREHFRPRDREYGSRDDRRDDRRRSPPAGRLGGRLELDARPAARFEPYARRPRDDGDWRGGGGRMRMDDMGGFRRRGSGGRGGRGGGAPKREIKSQEDLDKAMDSYWDSVSSSALNPLPSLPKLPLAL